MTTHQKPKLPAELLYAAKAARHTEIVELLQDNGDTPAEELADLIKAVHEYPLVEDCVYCGSDAIGLVGPDAIAMTCYACGATGPAKGRADDAISEWNRIARLNYRED